jgi:hypothetical protein
MEEDARFGKLWTEWDARVDAGETPADILRNAKDEDLVEVLGGESVKDRKYARDIIATELLNRLRFRSVEHPAAAKAAETSAKLAYEAARDGQEAIHTAEALLKASGQEKLGASVSASAFASLDASKAAFEAAREHADSLHQTLTESRVGGDLAREAARAAQEGSDITRDLGEQMKSIGKEKEGAAADQAGRKIQETADKAAEDAGTSHQEMESRE